MITKYMKKTKAIAVLKFEKSRLESLSSMEMRQCILEKNGAVYKVSSYSN